MALDCLMDFEMVGRVQGALNELRSIIWRPVTDPSIWALMLTPNTRALRLGNVEHSQIAAKNDFLQRWGLVTQDLSYVRPIQSWPCRDTNHKSSDERFYLSGYWFGI
jgi:hypothetical protein